MIVQCDKCKTKFRIADSKVTDAGVKVRCSRCAHVFIVKRDASALSSGVRSSASLAGDVPGFSASLADELRESGLSFGPPSGSSIPGFPAAPKYPVPSLVPDPPQPGSGSRAGRVVPNVPPAATTQDAMVALGFAAPPQRSNAPPAETVRMPLPPPPPPSAIGDFNPFLEDDPTHAYPGGVPPSIEARAFVQASSPPLPPASASQFGSPKSPPPGPPPFGAAQGSSPFASPKSPPPSPSPFAPTSAFGASQGSAPFPAPQASAFQSPHGSPPFGAKQGSSPFGGPQGSSPFGGPQGSSPFGGPQGSSPFGGPQGSSPFGGPQGSSPFGGPQGSSPFGPQQGSSPFGAPQGSSPFGAKQGSSPFGAKQGSAPFGSPPAAFGSQPPSQPSLPPSPAFGAAPGSSPFALAPSNPFGGPQGSSPSPSPFGAPPPGPAPSAAFGARGSQVENQPLARATQSLDANALRQKGTRDIDFGEDPSLTNPFFPPPDGLPSSVTRSGERPSASQELPLADIPSLFPGGPQSNDDPFAGLDLGLGSGYAGGDLSAEAPNERTGAIAPPGPQSPYRRIDLGRAGIPTSFEQNMATTRVASAMPLPSVEEPHTADMRLLAARAIGRWPTYVGLAIGLVITALAVLGPAGGDLSKLTPADVIALVSPQGEPVVAAVEEVVPRGAHVTTYAGKNGKKLLVVAGYAVNGGKDELSDLEVVAFVRQGRDIVEKRDAKVGVVIDEEALAGVASGADLEVALGERLKSSPSRELGTLKPGAMMPFMVVFPDPPDDLEHRSFHVEFKRGGLAKAFGR
jgi:predicted Zn finger-like uncharacterized protein